MSERFQPGDEVTIHLPGDQFDGRRAVVQLTYDRWGSALCKIDGDAMFYWFAHDMLIKNPPKKEDYGTAREQAVKAGYIVVTIRERSEKAAVCGIVKVRDDCLWHRQVVGDGQAVNALMGAMIFTGTADECAAKLLRLGAGFANRAMIEPMAGKSPMPVTPTGGWPGSEPAAATVIVNDYTPAPCEHCFANGFCWRCGAQEPQPERSEGDAMMEFFKRSRHDEPR